MRYCYPLALALSFVASASGAQSVSPSLNTTKVPELRVEIVDTADGGCWTNIGESKTYAEDKLRLLGYTISDKDSSYGLIIEVTAMRLANDLCVGNVDLSVEAFRISNGMWGYHQIAHSSMIASRTDNLNKATLDLVKGLLDVMGMSRS